MNLTLAGVPEHFNFPLKKAISQFQNARWVDVPGGTGAMRDMLQNQECDVAIMLTEGALVAIHNGLPASVDSIYVDSPLIWGVHVTAQSSWENVKEANHNFLVSRMGSGSHLMANVLADDLQWDHSSLNFEVIQNLAGARDAMNQGNEGLFLWEKFTTMPYVENGEMKRIGEVPTPWPCFVVVKHNSLSEEQESLLQNILQKANDLLAKLTSPQGQEEFAVEYNLPLTRIQEWMKQTSWFGKPWNKTEQARIEELLKRYALL